MYIWSIVCVKGSEDDEFISIIISIVGGGRTDRSRWRCISGIVTAFGCSSFTLEILWEANSFNFSAAGCCKAGIFCVPFSHFFLISFSVWITCIRLEGCKCEYDIKKTPHRIWNENALPKIGSIREIRRFSILFIYLFVTGGISQIVIIE